MNVNEWLVLDERAKKKYETQSASNVGTSLRSSFALRCATIFCAAIPLQRPYRRAPLRSQAGKNELATPYRLGSIPSMTKS